jgi:hypothetical protein
MAAPLPLDIILNSIGETAPAEGGIRGDRGAAWVTAWLPPGSCGAFSAGDIDTSAVDTDAIRAAAVSRSPQSELAPSGLQLRPPQLQSTRLFLPAGTPAERRPMVVGRYDLDRVGPPLTCCS